MQPKNLAGGRFGWRPLASSAADIRLWLVDVAADPAALPAAALALSPDEIGRADRLRRAEDRARFMLARSALRHLLAEATGRPPRSLAFAPGPFGKPELIGADGLHFNLSHSGALALIGISRRRPVGVDIELISETIDPIEIAGACFSDGERDYLKGIEGPARLRAFYHIWTLKEAVLKALGVGITAHLKEFEVRLDPAGVAVEAAPGGLAPALAAVRAAALDAPAGYAAACALA